MSHLPRCFWHTLTHSPRDTAAEAHIDVASSMIHACHAPICLHLPAYAFSFQSLSTRWHSSLSYFLPAPEASVDVSHVPFHCPSTRGGRVPPTSTESPCAHWSASVLFWRRPWPAHRPPFTAECLLPRRTGQMSGWDCTVAFAVWWGNWAVAPLPSAWWQVGRLTPDLLLSKPATSAGRVSGWRISSYCSRSSSPAHSISVSLHTGPSHSPVCPLTFPASIVS